MKLYNLAFPREGICTEQELYFRGGELRSDGIFVRGGETVSFDTYFNCFSHIKFKKFTQVARVKLRLDVVGKGTIEIRRYDENEDEIIKAAPIDGSVEIEFQISDIIDKGFLYFAVKATEDSIIRNGGWCVDNTPRPVKLGIVICTYHREQYVRRNIYNVKEYAKGLSEKFFDVFIIDNGKTLEDEFGEGVYVIPNENTGGSGGFTRGIKEVCARGGYTHFLLMDDDILFDVDVLQRTTAILANLKDEYCNASVGGAMLILDRRSIQEEMGADWLGCFLQSRRSKLDVRERAVICGNEEDVEPEYNAWFYMCMPVNTPLKYGYPLQLFIRCDDVEYGLRAAEHIITTSGLAVWHEAFDLKYSPEMEYYIKRNELIVNARYPKGKGAWANWKKLAFCVGKQLTFQRYYAVDLLFRAYDDFFKGPEFCFNLNSAEYHKQLRENCPKFLTNAELEEKFGVVPDLPQTHKKSKFRMVMQIVTFNGYFIPKCFYKKNMGQMEAAKGKYVEFYKRRRVLQYSSLLQKGFVTEIKKSALFTSGIKLICYLFKLIFNYRKTAKKYKEFEA